MNSFVEWCIIGSTITGWVSLALLVIVEDKLSEIKREISRLKKNGE